MNTDKKDINNILAAIEAVNKQTGYDIWIPSLDKRVKFKELTTGQQKHLIRAMVDNPVYRTNFIIAFYDIIKENCVDPSINIDNLFLSDKIAIAVQLRVATIGQVCNIEGKEINLAFTDVITQFAFDTELFKPHTFDFGGIKVVCTPPTIKREVTLEKELRTRIDATEIKNYEDVRHMLADAYIGEIAKHVTSFTINDTPAMSLSEENFDNVFAIVEKMPVNLIKQIVWYIEQVKIYYTKISSFLPVKAKDSGYDSADLEPIEISIDASLFVSK